MTTPLDAIFGDPSKGCRRFTDVIAMHWYPPEAQPGDSCYCGEITMEPPHD